MTRNYSDAIQSLNTLQSNHATVEAFRKSGQYANRNALPEMEELCRRIGYEPSVFDALNPIHLSGTKGKGSTSTFISSILSQFSPDIKKVGLYTSPHLRHVRERIQINNFPLSEVNFTRYFFEVWDRLYTASPTKKEDEEAKPPAPFYFKFLTLMAFHAYISEKVDVAVFECGIGGEYDSTNILTSPVVTAVTNLGIDHQAMLGKTVQEIAWHKAGIFKEMSKSRRAFTVASQPAEAMDVLRKRAGEKGLDLVKVPLRDDLKSGEVKLGLAAQFQRWNASLAVAVAAEFLFQRREPSISQVTLELLAKGEGTLPDEFKKGLETANIGGRCETRRDGRITWHLDGAHTTESIEHAAEWFVDCLSSAFPPSQSNDGSTTLTDDDAQSPSTGPRPEAQKQKRVLVFNQQSRDATALLRTLHTSLLKTNSSPMNFTHVIFTTNITSSSGSYKPDLVSLNASSEDVTALKVQKELAEAWKGLDGNAERFVTGSVEEAVGVVRRLAETDAGDKDSEEEDVRVFVTGSLHLVGGLLEVLESEKN